MDKKIITPNDKYHYFFGYYDLQPYNTTGSIHLAHRVAFCDRLPTKADVAEVGYIDIEKNRFVALAKTKAWNFQQGAILQWFQRDQSVIFNDFDGERYVSRIVDLNGKEIKRYKLPVATIDARAGVALSVNFSRIYDFRKGYGYSNIVDVHKTTNIPGNDGVFLLDLKTGEEKLLISYKQLAETCEELPFTKEKLVVNHITFSPSGKKFVLLLRNFSESGKKWGTALVVGDLQGRMTKLTNFEVNSHYSWKDDDVLMIYSGLPTWGIYFINVNTGARERLHNALCDKDDIHCNYSPNKQEFIGDGYPDENHCRALYHYDFNKKEAKELFKVYSVPVKDIDIRCDLHARWFDDGKKISYDTTENGCRQIAEVSL